MIKKKTKEENKYMGTSEAAELWGVSKSTVCKMCRMGEILAEHDGYGKPWRIPISTPNPFKIDLFNKD